MSTLTQEVDPTISPGKAAFFLNALVDGARITVIAWILKGTWSGRYASPGCRIAHLALLAMDLREHETGTTTCYAAANLGSAFVASAFAICIDGTLDAYKVTAWSRIADQKQQ